MKILFWLRSFFRLFFTIKTVKKAKELKLTFQSSIHGDEINAANARTIWKDKFNFIYFCKEYYEE